MQFIVKSGSVIKEYTVDGRELCYAVAKACTDALKAYGFKGYQLSTAGYYAGDSFDIQQLLFLKAYARGALPARETKALAACGDMDGVVASDFSKEIELLLFDM